MHTNVTITAIVPAYNVEDYIEEAVDSLLGQTNRFHEIILIDDGSTDSTPDLLDRYSMTPGVTVLHIKNSGQGNARNLGLRNASGEYVYFFDSDDILEKNFVTSMQALFNATPAIDIIYFSGESFLSSGCTSEYLPSYDRKIDCQYPSGVAATGAMLCHNVYFAQPCLYVSKTKLWRDNVLTFMDIVHEDEELILRLSCRAGVSLCINRVFYKRRIRSASIMTLPKSERNASGYLATLASIASYCKQNRQLVAPIRRELTVRFYRILQGYVAVCKLIPTRPQYQTLFRLLLQLGRPPALRQLYEMTVTPALHRKISRIKRRMYRL